MNILAIIPLKIGAAQILLLLFILFLPIVIFFLGYYFGKKAGYIKRIKETENKN